MLLFERIFFLLLFAMFRITFDVLIIDCDKKTQRRKHFLSKVPVNVEWSDL